MNPIKQELSELRQNIVLPLQIVAVMWLVKIIETLFHISFSNLGVLPRDVLSIWHIFTMPFVHGSWEHLISNSLPFIILGFLVLQTYKQVSLRIFTIVYALSGLGIWLMARGQSHHIGASGVIYGLAFFLFFSGIFRRDVKSMATALIVALFYGGMVWGLLPIQEGVSWEGHLFGALAGVWCAYRYKNINPPKRFPWQDEPQDEGKIIEEPFWVPKQQDKQQQIIPIDTIEPTDQTPPKKDTNSILDWDIKYDFKPKDKI